MSEKPPCECIEKIDGHWTYRCECSNGGDAEYAASWVADENAQDEITRLRNELHIAQVWSGRVIAGHEQDITEITALRAEVSELNQVFDARWSADMRAIECWRKENPGNELVLPDHVNLCLWLMEERTRLTAENERLTEWNREIAVNARELVAENERLRALAAKADEAIARQQQDLEEATDRAADCAALTQENNNGSD